MLLWDTCPQISGKYFSDKCHVNFGNFVNFSYIIFSGIFRLFLQFLSAFNRERIIEVDIHISQSYRKIKSHDGDNDA